MMPCTDQFERRLRPFSPAGILGQHLVDNILHGHDLEMRRDLAAVERRDVEQRAEQAGHRMQRAVDVLDHLLLFAVEPGVAQAGGEQADGMDRLAQVMAGLGQEA